MKILLILLGLSFSIQAATVINSSVVDIPDMKLVKFNVKNDSKKELYCRLISIPEVTYIDTGEYVESLEARVQNIVVGAKSSLQKMQEVDDSLRELFQLNSSLDLSYDDSSIQNDCEAKQSRLNWIHVIDDKRSCGGGFEQKSYKVDFGASNLIEEGKKLNLSLTDETKIYKSDFSNDYLKIEADAVYELQFDDKGRETSKKIFSLNNKKEAILGIFPESSNSFLIYLLTMTDVEIRRYVRGDNGDFVVGNLFVTTLFDYKKFYNDNSKYYPESETQGLYYSFESHFKDFASTVDVIHSFNQENNLMELVFTFRIPDFRGIQTKLNRKTFKWEEPKGVLSNFKASIHKRFVQVDLGLSNFELLRKENINLRQFKDKINRLQLSKALTWSREVKFKNLKIIGNSSKLSYAFDNNVKEIDGFCRIQQVFSDKIIAREGRDLDELFRGRTLLVKALMEHNYDNALNFLSEGARTDISDFRGNAPIHYSVGFNDSRFLKLLLSNNANVNKTNKSGETALHREIEQRFSNKDFIKNLPEAALVKIVNASLENIDILIKFGADTSLKNIKGESVLDLLEKYEVPGKITSSVKGSVHE